MKKESLLRFNQRPRRKRDQEKSKDSFFYIFKQTKRPISWLVNFIAAPPLIQNNIPPLVHVLVLLSSPIFMVSKGGKVESTDLITDPHFFGGGRQLGMSESLPRPKSHQKNENSLGWRRISARLPPPAASTQKPKNIQGLLNSALGFFSLAVSLPFRCCCSSAAVKVAKAAQSATTRSPLPHSPSAGKESFGSGAKKEMKMGGGRGMRRGELDKRGGGGDAASDWRQRVCSGYVRNGPEKGRK